MPIQVKAKISTDAGNAVRFGSDKGLFAPASGSGTAGAFVVTSATSTTPVAGTFSVNTETYLHGVNVALTAGRTYVAQFGYSQYPATTTGTFAQGWIRLIAGAGSTTVNDGTLLDTAVRHVNSTQNIFNEHGSTPPFQAPSTGTFTVKITARMGGTTWTDPTAANYPKQLVIWDVTDATTGAPTPATPGAYNAGSGVSITSFGTNNDFTAGNGLTVTGTDVVDGSETKVTAGANIAVSGSGTAAAPYVVTGTGGGGVLVGAARPQVNQAARTASAVGATIPADPANPWASVTLTVTAGRVYQVLVGGSFYLGAPGVAYWPVYYSAGTGTPGVNTWVHTIWQQSMGPAATNPSGQVMSQTFAQHGPYWTAPTTGTYTILVAAPAVLPQQSGVQIGIYDRYTDTGAARTLYVYDVTSGIASGVTGY